MKNLSKAIGSCMMLTKNFVTGIFDIRPTVAALACLYDKGFVVTFERAIRAQSANAHAGQRYMAQPCIEQVLPQAFAKRDYLWMFNELARMVDSLAPVARNNLIQCFVFGDALKVDR
jgi:hypothetical protein